MSVITVDSIKRIVADRYQIPARLMTSRAQYWAAAHPRQVAMMLAYEMTHHSLSNVGRMFGGRDHATVTHAIKAVAIRASRDPLTASLVSQIRTEIVERTGCSSGTEQTTRPVASAREIPDAEVTDHDRPQGPQSCPPRP